MYAVIEKDTERIIRECNTKEAAIVAAQLEKEKLALADRQNILLLPWMTAVSRISCFERSPVLCRNDE